MNGLEIAARRLCEMRGIDPDSMIHHVGTRYRKAWEQFTGEIYRHLEIEAAVKFAADQIKASKLECDVIIFRPVN